MRRSLLGRAGALCAVSVIGATGLGARDPDRSPLALQQPVERSIARGEEHQFAVALAAGEYASAVIQQRGVDVLATVSDPQGHVVEQVQDELRSAGEEHVELAATSGGIYVIAVRAASSAVNAGGYVIQLDTLRRATEADRRMQEARTLRTRARDFEQTGGYAEARPLFERAIAIGEAVGGPDDLFAAMTGFELAGNALERLDNATARALYDRALVVFTRTWGPEHPYPAMTRSRLALLDERASQRRKAETALQEVLPILERTLGTAHPWYLRSLATLADLREAAGDLAEAERINRAALATIEQTGQTRTILEAGFLNNLADVLRSRNDLAAAEPLFRRSLEIGESIVGPNSLFVATALQNLGIMARERKDYAAATEMYTRAIAIRERALGPDDPSLAGVFNNFATLYRAEGQDEKALALHFRALRLWDQAFGPYARETLLSVGNIARTYAAMGDIDHALVYQRRADAILETQMSLYLAMGSERQKLAFARGEAERTDRTLSLHLRQAPDRSEAAELAALVLLQRKGRVQDAMTDLFGQVRQRVTDAADRALLDELKETTTALARIALGGGDARSPEGRASIASIEARREQLESTLSDHNAEFRAQVHPVTLDAVRAAIPGDAVLIEYAVFRPFDPGAERNEEAYGAPHYAAYVIGKHGSPIGVDLGAVEDIDALVSRLRDSLRDPASADVTARARALDERILHPLRASVSGSTRLLISPDGALNLLPFEALVDEHGRFVIERYTTSYLTSGRDLLRMPIARGRAGNAVIVADPLFGDPSASVAVPHTHTPAARDTRRSVTAGRSLNDLYFSPLAGTAIEGRAIKALFPDATLLMGRRATKAEVQRVSAPAILHIASHGFFLDDVAGDASAVAQNPLLRSGLALAGANIPGDGHGRGILTALEAAGLDLWGTHLVTLSACDTGVGDVRDGEGVYGMRRAFTLAGAETLVMSLWPVGDAIARDTMVGYYGQLRAGAGRGDALRHAKLSILRHPATRHPYFWAGFIQSGDWTRLQS
jgi:CHAT domain-containing protein/tetratricopeptide (TPR) repeat protein